MPVRATPDSDTLGRFIAIVGEANAVSVPPPDAPFLRELRGAFNGATPLLLRPGSPDEVGAILSLASETGTPIVPQGGNTGLVGGQIPDDSGTQLLLSLERINRIRSVDATDNSMVAEAGVTLADARRAAAAVGRLFPLAIGSMETCQIGGNISTNAGGVAVLAYGNARNLVLGLEIVLANGERIDGLRTLRKDNAGYDLKQLFIGAEGTLGVVTAAALKLAPAPKGKATAIVGLADPAAAIDLLHTARERVGFELTSFELMPRICIDFCLRHLPDVVDPLPDKYPWYVLAEISSGRSADAAREDLAAVLDTAGTAASSRLAETAGAADQLWRMRLSLSHVQRPEGISIKHDISVPIAAIPGFISDATAAVMRLAPGARPVPFGHVGDGNIHFNVSQPVDGDPDGFRAQTGAINEAVFGLVAKYRGSIAAEHGIGQMKRDLLPGVRSAAEMDVMRRIKSALDPAGILNPGKVLSNAVMSR